MINSLTQAVTDSDHIWGNPNASIVLVEYGDLQCPHCGRAFPIIRQIKQDMKESIKFVFRHFPLTKIHPQAKPAALATEAAARQNRFWQMHDMIFENQKRLTNTALIEYATALELDLDRFQTDLKDELLHKKVDSDFMSGLRSGVNATPSFFINGQRYQQSWEGNDLKNYLLSLV
jgi:protein-disulfide isomerase